MSTRWVGVMALAAVGLLPSACMAQYRPHGHGHGYGHDRRDGYSIGHDRGYQEGARHGRVDGHRHDSYNFWHDHEYREADAGYRRYYGSRQRYSSGFRRGYERGYRRAFDLARREHRHRGHHCDASENLDRAVDDLYDRDRYEDGRVYKDRRRRY